MGGEMPGDPSQVGPPAAPTDPHAPNAFHHYPQEAVHDPAAAERAAQEAAAVRAPPPAGGPVQQAQQPAEQPAAPEQPPLQPA
jgi:hypothetical protein